MTEPATLSDPPVLEKLVPQAETFLVEGLYIGLLSRHRPPTEVREWFDNNHVCEMLNTHVKRKNKSTVYLTAIVLCMAGQLDGVQVRLTPTVWISGGDKRSKSSIKNSIGNASYLNKFLTKFQMREPHVTASGPEILSGVKVSSEAGVHTFEIRAAADESLDSVCGTSARFTMEATSDGSTFKCYSTIGGLILVDGDLFAITTAHAITKYGMPNPKDIVMDGTNGDTYAITTTHAVTKYEVPDLQEMVINGTDDSSVLSGSHMREWEPSPFPNAFAYLGDAYIQGVKVDKPIVDAADFALVESKSLRKLGYNTYQIEGWSHFEAVSGYIPTSELKSGDVTICTNDYRFPMKGTMVEGDAPIIVGGVVMLTKMIEVTKPAAPGLSGSWVVQDGKLCGVVYAGNASIPYLYIIPAEIMLEDVKKLLGSGTVGVATAQSISEWKLRNVHDRTFESSAYESSSPDVRIEASQQPGEISLDETYQVGDLVRTNAPLVGESQEVYTVYGGWIDQRGSIQYTLQRSDRTLVDGGKGYHKHELELVARKSDLPDDGGREHSEREPESL